MWALGCGVVSRRPSARTAPRSCAGGPRRLPLIWGTAGPRTTGSTARRRPSPMLLSDPSGVRAGRWGPPSRSCGRVSLLVVAASSGRWVFPPRSPGSRSRGRTARRRCVSSRTAGGKYRGRLCYEGPALVHGRRCWAQHEHLPDPRIVPRCSYSGGRCSGIMVPNDFQGDRGDHKPGVASLPRCSSGSVMRSPSRVS